MGSARVQVQNVRTQLFWLRCRCSFNAITIKTITIITHRLREHESMLNVNCNHRQERDLYFTNNCNPCWQNSLHGDPVRFGVIVYFFVLIYCICMPQRPIEPQTVRYSYIDYRQYFGYRYRGYQGNKYQSITSSKFFIYCNSNIVACKWR